ncbi:Glutamine ABC transporter, periplasmic glutamine-binding protein (TC 3.A.1.3.2) [Alloactinosynnema sp. L-07]|uniref:glutamate ABC transporter substrate-binding protein n=1 Tax=Alloactinosynnema sp. L-07 TaxID=1653480 RepID=UPI00065F08FC|nr:glutamate ABC transporter substrate-binding protein [Alloactinosynnema sp. L-07]CRK60348.1 Glutamine ABC transporter, periplasmic glutamine-binding protein (TC 3.A.1.3.2) [Alloactinosynnema sp. L-07]
MTRMRRLTAGLALALLAAGCSATGRPVDLASIASAQRPEPVGVVVNPPATTGAAAQVPECDPAASLRPAGLPGPGAMPAGSTMRTIQDRGRLIAGVDQNTFLFGFRDPTSNTIAGFDIDRVREIAAAIFGDPNKVQFKVITSAERIPALQKGEVDIVVRTMTATCARWVDINFSAIYYVAGQRVLVDKSSQITGVDQLGGQRVCATKGSTSLNKLRESPAPPVAVAVDNWSDCLLMLQQGQVAAVSTDDTILAGMIAQDPNVKMVGARFTQEPYGIGIPKANVDMVRFVNAVLEKSINSGSWATSYGTWLTEAVGQVAPPTLKYRD